MNQLPSAEVPPLLDWSQIDDVLIDMDGTLLDRHFDNFFFEEELPRRYALREKLSLDESRARLMAMYRSVEEELAWTDLHYWTSRVGIDVVAMHRELDHMIGFLPGAAAFLSAVRHQKKRVTVLTNAHPAGVAIKTAKTGLEARVDRIVDAFEVGYLKMRPQYWPACLDLVKFDPTRALFIDDDERCLAAARQFGVLHLLHSARSSTKSPPAFSASFRSVQDLSSLLNGTVASFR